MISLSFYHIRPAYCFVLDEKFTAKGELSLIHIFASIGHGGLKEGQIVNKLVSEYEKDHVAEVTDEDIIRETNNAKNSEHRRSDSKSGIIVEGMDDVAVRFSKCCSPVPGDEIVGFVTRGRCVDVYKRQILYGIPKTGVLW